MELGKQCSLHEGGQASPCGRPQIAEMIKSCGKTEAEDHVCCRQAWKTITDARVAQGQQVSLECCA